MKSTFLAGLLALGWALAGAEELTLAQLAADPQLWPPEVTTTGSVRGTMIKDGQPAGAMLVGAGKKLAVVGIASTGLTGRFGSVTVLVPVEKTNLWTEVARMHPESTPPAPAAVPVAAPKAPPPARAAAPAKAEGPSAMQRRLAGHLVRLDHDELKAVDAAALQKVKYYGLYYSASWCGPCRQFTPQFIQVYRQMKQRHPEFEVVFVSADRSERAMRSYIKDDGMPWLAVDYDTAQQDGELRRYCGPGIPCLVLVDPQGRVLSDSFEGDNYVGPGKVLDDANRLLAQGN